MFVTDHFVFLHLPKTAGVYVESVCRENLRMPIHFARAHAKFVDLPKEFAHLPTIGVLRDPWDWYASFYYYAKMERNAATSDLVALGSDGFTLSFEDTLERLLDPDEEFMLAYEKRMRDFGGKVKDFECLDEGSLRRLKESGLGLMGFLSQEIFPKRLDIEWRMETLRKEMFAYLSPLCADREKFRQALVSPPRNVSSKPGLAQVYTKRGVELVARKESFWIEKLNATPPRLFGQA